MNHSEFLLQLDKITEHPMGTLTGEELLRDVYGWDSMAVIAFIAMADEKFNHHISAKEINSCVKVSDLANLLGDHLK